MKLKGERELLAEEMYNTVEIELFELIKEETNKISNCVDKLESNDSEDIVEAFETVCNSNDLIYVYRKTAEALLKGDFTLEEIKVLCKFGQDIHILKLISEAINKLKEKININNVKEVADCIKMLLMLNLREE